MNSRRCFAWIVALVLAIAVVPTAGNRPDALAAPPKMAVGYAGIDYVNPGNTFTGCPYYTWLQANCYNSSAALQSAQSLLGLDLDYIKSQNLGTFQRVWISLDQLFDRSKWSNTTGYGGYDPQALANVDDALHQFAAHGIKVDLVLYTYADTTNSPQFDPAAIDGNHAQMRAGYLQALHDFHRPCGRQCDRREHDRGHGSAGGGLLPV